MLVERGDGLLLIDVRAGRRALVKDRLDEFTRITAPVSRPLLIPHTRTVSEDTADAVDDAGSSLRSLGIEIRRGAPGAISMRAIPAILGGVPHDDLLDTVVGWAGTSGGAPVLVESLAALAESRPFDGDIGHVVDAVLADRLGAAVVTVDEVMLRWLFAGATRR